MPSSATTATLVSLLSIALVVAGLGNTAASIADQVDEAVAHGQALVDDARTDPRTAAANATNASWQGGELNWTVAWGCDTVAVLSEDGERQLQAHGVCPEADDVQAGAPEPQAQAQHPSSRAVPATNQTTVDDQINRTLRFVDEVVDDPSRAADRLEAFVNHTVRWVRHLFGLPGDALDVVRDAVGDVADAIEGVGDTIGGAAVELTRTAGSALRDAGDTLAGTGHEAWDEVAGIGRETASTLGELVRDLVRLTKEPLRELGDAAGTADRTPPSDAADGLLDGLGGVDGLLP